MMRIVRPFLADARGGAAAEMALLLPLVLALLVAAFEGGYYMWSEHKVIKGVRDGARFAGRQFFSNVDCAGGTFLDSATLTAISQVTRTGFVSGDNPNIDGTDNPVVPDWTADEVSVEIACDTGLSQGIYTDLAGGAPNVIVSATVDYPTVFGNLLFDDDDLKLRASAHAAVMGT